MPSARLTGERRPGLHRLDYRSDLCIASYTLMSLERAKKLKEVTLKTLLHTAGQKGIIVVANTKARLSINARLGNSLPVIDHKQAVPKKNTAQMRHSCALSLPKKELCHNQRTFYQQTEANIAITPHPTPGKAKPCMVGANLAGALLPCSPLLVIMIVGLFIDQIQGHKHVERVDRKRAQSTEYPENARIFKSRRRAT